MIDVIEELRGNAAYLESVRAFLFAAIADSLRESGHCKSYEGAFSIGLPNYFERDGETGIEPWVLKLHCYVIGPRRHYQWHGTTLSYCIDAAKRDIEQWVAEFREEAARP